MIYAELDMTPTAEYTEVLKIVTSWPIDQRVALAHEVLQSAEKSQLPKRRPSFELARGIAKTGGVAPDDEQVKHWIGEHRMEKYG
jgi:hypothetical protein